MTKAIISSALGQSLPCTRLARHCARKKSEGLRYGVGATRHVHDGRVTQIERTEKTRLGSPAPARTAADLPIKFPRRPDLPEVDQPASE